MTEPRVSDGDIVHVLFTRDWAAKEWDDGLPNLPEWAADLRDARQRIAELEAEYAEAREVRYLLQSAITAIAPTAERLSKMIADLMPALGYLSAELTEVKLMSPQVGILINILKDYPEDAIVVVDNSKGGLRIVDRNRTISRIHLNDYGVRNGN